MVPSRSRKTAGRRSAGLGRAHLRGGEPRLRGRRNMGGRNSRHAAMIGGAAAQETWAAVGLFLHYGAAWSDWRSALRICRTENCHDGQADRGSHVHGARIVADKEMALGEQGGKIGNGRFSSEVNGRAAHAG